MKNESDQKPPQETTPEDPTPNGAEGEESRFNWEYRNEFRVNTQMRDLVQLTRVVTETEIDRLRRKLEKLNYGG